MGRGKSPEALRKEAVGLFVKMCVVGVLLVIGALTAVLFLFGIRPYVVVTGSMEPAVHLGSVCLIDMDYPYNDVKKDDIIAYHNGGLLVTHRVTSVDKNGLTTKGDAAPKPDTEPITRHNFGGKVVFTIPYLGYAVIIVRSYPQLCVAAVLLVVLADVVIRLIKNRKKSGAGNIG